MKAKPANFMAHFVVTGEFLTQQARSFWADEDEPDKALGLLQCLRGISEAQILDVLEGRKKLTGDSDSGIRLAPDNQTAKMPTLTGMIKKLKSERDAAREDVADATALLSDDTVAVSSAGGLRLVPFRKTQNGPSGRRVLADGYDFEDSDPETREPGTKSLIFYRQVNRRDAFEGSERARGENSLLQQGEEALEEELSRPKTPRAPRVKLEPDEMITGTIGWLSPDGKFYGCRYGQHNWIASALGFEPGDLDKKGWVRLQVSRLDGSDVQHFFHDDYKTVTEIQNEKIKHFCSRTNTALPFWLEKLE